MSNGTLKTNNCLSPSEWKAILVKWIKTPNIAKPNQRGVPTQLSGHRGEFLSKSGRDRMSLGVNRWGCVSSLAPRAPGKGRWTELKWGGKCIFGSRPSVITNGNQRLLRMENIYWLGCSPLECYQWKIKVGPQSADLFSWHISLRFFKVHSGCLPKTIF